MITRRGFLQAVLAAGVAPYIGRANALMKSPTFGRMLPLIWGTVRVPGYIVRMGDLTERTERGSFFTAYRYEVPDLQIGCGSHDPETGRVNFINVDSVNALWADGRQIYPGALDGGLALTNSGMLKFRDAFDVTPYGNRIPEFVLEVQAR